MENEIFALLQNADFEGAAELANKLSAEDLATLLGEMGDEILAPFCRALESDLLAEVLLLLDKNIQEKILHGLHDDELEKDAAGNITGGGAYNDNNNPKPTPYPEVLRDGIVEERIVAAIFIPFVINEKEYIF